MSEGMYIGSLDKNGLVVTTEDIEVSVSVSLNESFDDSIDKVTIKAGTLLRFVSLFKDDRRMREWVILQPPNASQIRFGLIWDKGLAISHAVPFLPITDKGQIMELGHKVRVTGEASLYGYSAFFEKRPGDIISSIDNFDKLYLLSPITGESDHVTAFDPIQSSFCDIDPSSTFLDQDDVDDFLNPPPEFKAKASESDHEDWGVFG